VSSSLLSEPRFSRAHVQYSLIVWFFFLGTGTYNPIIHDDNELTTCSRVLPEKLTGPKLLKKFPAFYGTQRFITTFTTARHLSLFRARSIQSMPPHPASRRSILLLSSHLRLGLRSGLVPSGLTTKTLYAPLLTPYVPHVLPISVFLTSSRE
jgi:hypothetical protein